MIIKDIIISVPSSVFALLKAVKIKADDRIKDDILEKGLYHITSDEQTVDKIINTQYLKPATGIFKNINSYGKASVCFFNGPPEIGDYMHNMNRSPYINPTKVEPALKVMPRDKTELTNYKVRPLSDNAVLLEGYCMLKTDEIEKVFLVPDLIRDNEGNPIINNQTKRYDIAFREAKEEELNIDKTTYIPRNDYLMFIEEERKRLHYLENGKLIGKIINPIIMTIDIERKMRENSVDNIKNNLPNIIKQKIKNLFLPKLEASTDERIEQNIRGFNTSKKNPYRSKRFSDAVISARQEGLMQLELKDELEKLTTSKDGEYFRKKNNQVSQFMTENQHFGLKKHDLEHSNRVALLSMIIAKKEGVLENDIEDKTKDILLSASYYHEIGRRRNAIKFNYANGRKYKDEDSIIAQAIIESCKRKDKSMDKICEKYKIPIEKEEYARKLMNIIKDANALDRVRFDLNLQFVMKPDLNPKYLRTNSSKQLLDVSYQLEDLTHKVEFDRIISYKTGEQIEGGIIGSKRKEFIEGLKKGVVEYAPKIKRKLDLCKEKKNFYGNNIFEKINQILYDKNEEKNIANKKGEER